MIVQENNCENHKMNCPNFGGGAKRIETRATCPVIETIA